MAWNDWSVILVSLSDCSLPLMNDEAYFPVL